MSCFLTIICITLCYFIYKKFLVFFFKWNKQKYKKEEEEEWGDFAHSTERKLVPGYWMRTQFTASDFCESLIMDHGSVRGPLTWGLRSVLQHTACQMPSQHYSEVQGGRMYIFRSIRKHKIPNTSSAGNDWSSEDEAKRSKIRIFFP